MAAMLDEKHPVKGALPDSKESHIDAKTSLDEEMAMDTKSHMDEKVVESSVPSLFAEANGAIEDGKAAEDQFMSGAKLNILVLGLGVAVFIMAIDMSIIVTAIPELTAIFHATEDIGWYVSGYMLTVCSLQPLSGKLYANFSLKWTFMVFFMVFEVGSAISGAATSSAMLIVGRTIAGAGAAGLMSGTLSILAVAVSLRLRGIYTGIISSLFGIAAIAGPLMGGALTQHVSWRWVFYINLPVGGVTIAALIFLFHPPERASENDPIRERIRRLDIPGAFLFIPAVVMILMALQWGGVTYPWSSSRIIGLFVGAGVVLVIFGLWQWRAGDDGMLPASIMLQRTVFWASLSALFGMGAQMMLGLWMPEWFQAIKGASPTASGVRLLPSMLAQVISSIITGAAITQLGYYNPWLLLGTALSGIGSGLFTTFKVDTGSSHWIGYMVIFGLGGGMFMTVPLISVQAVLDPARTPIGISTITFFQMFGGAFFSAISQTIFNEQLLKQLHRNVPDVDVTKLLAAGTVGVQKVVSPEQLSGVLHSYNVAILDPFYLATAGCVVSFFCAFGLEWVSVKGKNLLAGEAA